MKLLKAYKNISTAFLLALYIFVAFFAVNLHNHDSGMEFRDFQFKKTENTIAKADHHKEFVDCLSCHVFHEGKNLVPHQFSFSFLNEIFFQHQVFAFEQRFASVSHFTAQLRGPPTV